MDFQIAPHAGFCFGVKRAVNMVYEEVDKAIASGENKVRNWYVPGMCRWLR